MSEQMQGREIKVNKQRITIYNLNLEKGAWYSHIYQNNATREIDSRFGLKGESVPRGSEEYDSIMRSTGYCSLGKIEVETALNYFGFLATQCGNFVGIPEKEVKEHISKGEFKGRLTENDIEIAMRYKDFMRKGVTYLDIMNIEGTDVLFPQNLEKMLF